MQMMRWQAMRTMRWRIEEMALRGPLHAEASQFNNRQRNLKDLEKLRVLYPGYCTHHMFYRHVLQAPDRGCSLVPADAAGC